MKTGQLNYSVRYLMCFPCSFELNLFQQLVCLAATIKSSNLNFLSINLFFNFQSGSPYVTPQLCPGIGVQLRCYQSTLWLRIAVAFTNLEASQNCHTADKVINRPYMILTSWFTLYTPRSAVLNSRLVQDLSYSMMICFFIKIFPLSLSMITVRDEGHFTLLIVYKDRSPLPQF